MGPQEAPGTPFAFRLMDVLDAESLPPKMSGPAMGLGVREGKDTPWGRQKTPSDSTKQSWLWGRSTIIPSFLQENPVMIPLIIQDSPKICLKGSLPHLLCELWRGTPFWRKEALEAVVPESGF